MPFAQRSSSPPKVDPWNTVTLANLRIWAPFLSAPQNCNRCCDGNPCSHTENHAFPKYGARHRRSLLVSRCGGQEWVVPPGRWTT